MGAKEVNRLEVMQRLKLFEFRFLIKARDARSKKAGWQALPGAPLLP